ncbi:MAG: hypothetical protein K8W52_39995 [Deltaproteobacteria bacterium]|nr:hypothetical protein [Deltaproteobacteria bacterium]
MKPWQRWVVRGAWLLIALPALWQVATLLYTITQRVAYPYDLEWMEGGMLHHAQWIADGDGIYGPPSIDFIPYLYTPLYPGVIATLGGLFGISYALGRAVSILSLFGIGAVTIAAITGPARRAARAGADDRIAAWLGVALALGGFAAAYPYCEGWYDLVRCDTFFLFLVTAGLHCAVRWSRTGEGWGAAGRMAAVGMLMALTFFAKQTGILYVGLGGLFVLVLAWRRVPIYALAAAAVGLGGVVALQRRTDGWFWYWIHDVHQSHDFNMKRFWDSFGNILGHFPLLTAIVAIGLIVVAVTAIVRRTLPPAARPLLVWTPVYAVSIIVGALGFGTQWAVFNAYMPAMLHGAIAAGCALPAIAACVRVLAPNQWASRTLVSAAAVVVVAAPGAYNLWTARWSPKPFVPTAADVAGGDELIKRIAAVDGDVWVMFEPWYGHLAGKRMFTHRMGIGDVGVGKAPRPVLGLSETLRDHAFAAIVLDSGAQAGMLGGFYRPDDRLPPRPEVRTGNRIVPASIWVPAIASRPPIGARILFDFESGTFDGWTITGTGWGPRPEMRELAGQPPVCRFGGRFFAISSHGGKAAVGTMTSAPFPIDGKRLTFRIGGEVEGDALRVALIVDGREVLAALPSKSGETLEVVTWDVSPLAGKTATLTAVDESATGHLILDDVLIWN